jgi:hypothetical protein
LYALYSGVVFLVVVVVVFAPVLLRILHRLHLDTEDDDGATDDQTPAAQPSHPQLPSDG